MQEEAGACWRERVGVSASFEVRLRSTYKAVQLGFSEGLIINGNTLGSAN